MQSALSDFEPRLIARVLRACACGAPHPEAMGSTSATCLSCGSTIPPSGPPIVARAVVTGGGAAGFVARVFLAIGRMLRALSERM